MNITWNITSEDVRKVRELHEAHRDDPFVKDRVARNLEGRRGDIDREYFFWAIIACLITTQQRSGPESRVTKFLNHRPFPLPYADCVGRDDLAGHVAKVITDFGGLRRANRIGEEVECDLRLLEDGLWKDVFDFVAKLEAEPSATVEREAVKFTIRNFRGFGPKQSRNLWQTLGLTRYEIPIDSRITKWLNEFGFPMKLSASALSDENYYEFVSDGIQKLSEASGLLPCVLDALIFTSFDAKKWESGTIVSFN